MRSKILVYMVVGLICVLCGAICCGDQNNSRSLTTSITSPTPPATTDADGDTVPDSQDCAPNDPDHWQWLIFYPDSDRDGIPDDWHGTRFCVGAPASYPQDWTINAPPPLDPCLNDAQNTCQTLRPYLKIDFSFTTTTSDWTMFGKCFPPPDPPDNFPEMGNGAGINGVAVGDINPAAVTIGYCDFAINFKPSISNSCGTADNWLPCQSSTGTLYSGLDGDGLATIDIFLSPTGYVTDEIELTWTVVDNGQHGGNFRINLQTGNNGGGDVNIIASLPIDTDGDGILNPNDNCIWVENPGQEANPGNLIGANGLRVGNACLGIDTDNDGYLDGPDACPLDPTCH